MEAASSKYSAELFRIFLKSGCDANAQNHDGVTALMALMWALHNHEKSGIRVLLQAGANVNLCDAEGKNALSYAVLYAAGAPVVGQLLKAGADMHVRDEEGRTPLMYVGILSTMIKRDANNDNAYIRALLASGVDVHARDDTGRTALMYAAENCKDPESLRLLLGAGIDAGLQDNDGHSALDYAALSPHEATRQKKMAVLQAAAASK